MVVHDGRLRDRIDRRTIRRAYDRRLARGARRRNLDTDKAAAVLNSVAGSPATTEVSEQASSSPSRPIQHNCLLGVALAIEMALLWRMPTTVEPARRARFALAACQRAGPRGACTTHGHDSRGSSADFTR